MSQPDPSTPAGDLTRGRNPFAEGADWRRVLHQSVLGRLEDASYSGTRPPPSGHSPDFQVALTYRGAFRWRAGSRQVFVDPNQCLLVCGGEDYEEGYPHAGGMACLVLTPAPELLEKIAGCDHRKLHRHPAFARQTLPATAGIGLWVQRLRALPSAGCATLDGDELLIAALTAVLAPAPPPPMPSSRARRLIDQTRELLHAREGERLSLAGIAHEIGVSGVYLTQLFSALEGVPLYRYQQHLRLKRALHRLPDSPDLTDLALELGFSSHSHFTEAFRKTFGLTPSAFRATRSRQVGTA